MAIPNNKRNVISRAKTLRQVRLASQLFLDRWAAQKLSGNAKGIERIVLDVRQFARVTIAAPHDHNWSILYDGSVLDD
jgi:hypothetical protein